MERDKLNIGKLVNNKFVRVATAAVAIGAVERVAARAGFDSLAGTRNVADELVVKDAHKAYDQIVDILPDADEAEAQTPPAETNVFSPSSLRGWAPLSLNGGLLTFVSGTAHLDSGSANFTTPGGGSAEASLGTSFADPGVDLTSVTKLQYWSLAKSQTGGNNNHAVLYMNVNTAAGPDTLTFDPNDQPGGSQFNTWELEAGDAVDAAWNSIIDYSRPNETLQQYATRIQNNYGGTISITSITFKVGPTSSVFDAYADEFTMGVSGVDTTYDFEPDGGVPTATLTEAATNTATATPTPTETPIPPTSTPTRTPTNTSIPGSPPPLSVGGIAEMVDPEDLEPLSVGTGSDSTKNRVAKGAAVAGFAASIVGVAASLKRRRSS